jgi:cytochrome c oxidase subunit III
VAASTGGLVAHHFDSLKQQQATVRFGMWLFLLTEVLFFGGAFVAYTAYRIWFPKDFEAGSAALNVGIATVNTFLLLTSSLTCTLGIRSAYHGSVSGLKFWLGMTIILGTLFLGLKAREYYLDYEEGLLPGARTTTFKQADGTETNAEAAFVKSLEKVLHEKNYDMTGVDPRRVQLFFIFYYSMTGLHVIHMIVGVGLLSWQWTLAQIGFFDRRERYVYVEVLSLYWHIVDMVWMFLMPMLYMAGPHTVHEAVDGFKHAIGVH